MVLFIGHFFVYNFILRAAEVGSFSWVNFSAHHIASPSLLSSPVWNTNLYFKASNRSNAWTKIFTWSFHCYYLQVLLLTVMRYSKLCLIWRSSLRWLVPQNPPSENQPHVLRGSNSVNQLIRHKPSSNSQLRAFVCEYLPFT